MVGVFYYAKNNKRRVLQMENTYAIRWIVQDLETGKVRHVPENGNVTTKTPQEVRSDRQQAFLNKKENQKIFNKMVNDRMGNFYFYFYNSGLQALDVKESIKTRFLYLATYSGYAKDGGYICHDNGKKMKRKDVQELLGLSTKHCQTTINELVKCGLLFEDGEYLQVNTTVAHKGELKATKKKCDYTRVFLNGVRNLYKNCTATQHKQLYYLFRLLPYVNLKFNAICQNPTEEIAEDVIALRLNEICELVGVDKTNMSRWKRDMYKLEIFGCPVIKGIEGKYGMWFKVNPRVMYGGTEGHMEELDKLLCSDFSIK